MYTYGQRSKFFFRTQHPLAYAVLYIVTSFLAISSLISGLAGCSSDYMGQHLSITQQQLPERVNPLTAERLEQLKTPGALFTTRLKDFQLPHGYHSILNLSTAPRQLPPSMPGIPPLHLHPSHTPDSPLALNNFPPRIELRETTPAPCLSLIASPLYNQPKPIEFSPIKDIDIDYFGSEFHQIHEEILLYPTEQESLDAFSHVIHSGSQCKKFSLTTSDGGKSTAIFSLGTSPRLGMKSLAYVVLNVFSSRTEYIQTNYIYLGSILLRVTAMTPANDAWGLNFKKIVNNAVGNILS